MLRYAGYSEEKRMEELEDLEQSFKNLESWDDETENADTSKEIYFIHEGVATRCSLVFKSPEDVKRLQGGACMVKIKDHLIAFDFDYSDLLESDSAEKKKNDGKEWNDLTVQYDRSSKKRSVIRKESFKAVEPTFPASTGASPVVSLKPDIRPTDQGLPPLFGRANQDLPPFYGRQSRSEIFKFIGKGRTMPLRRNYPSSVKIILFYVEPSYPGCFWGALYDSKDLKIMFSLDLYKSQFKPFDGCARKVVVLCEGSYCRAWLKSLINGTAHMFMIDYGDMRTMHRDDLLIAPSSVWDFPPLAIPFRHPPDLNIDLGNSVNYIHRCQLTEDGFDDHVLTVSSIELVPADNL